MGTFKAIVNYCRISFNRTVSSFCYFFLAVIVLLCSGNGLVLFSSSSKVRILLYGVTGLALLILFVLPIKPKSLLSKIKRRDFGFPSVRLLLAFSFFTVLLLSFLFNANKGDNLNTYLDIAFTVAAAFLFCARIKYREFSKYFNAILIVITIVSLLLYAMVCIGRYSFAVSSFISGSFRYDNYLLGIFYNEKMYGIGGDPRFCSIFWEPGVCGTFLLIGILNELLFKKTNYISISIFLVGLFFTSSTASLILLPLLVIIFFSVKTKGAIRRRTIIVSSSACFVFFVAILFFPNQLSSAFPSLFGKLTGSISLRSRINSPYYYLVTFASDIKTVFLGMGGYSANKFYYAITDGKNVVDSGTSTSCYLMASYGLLGALFTMLPIISVFFVKKWKLSTKLPLVILFFLVFNKENHASVLYTMIIIFSLVGCIPQKVRKKPKLSETSNEKTLKELLLGKNENGAFGRNVFGSLFLKIAAVVVSILTIPVYTSFFGDSHNLDVWLVIYSVLSWILLFDFGFGNGMKNKLINYFSKGDHKQAKEIISNTYIPTAIIALLIFSILAVLCVSVDLNVVFGDSDHIIDSSILRTSLLIILASICIQFVLRNISFIYQAQNRNVLGSSFSLISSSLFLSFLGMLRGFNGPKFIVIAIAYIIAINVPLLIANLSFFRKNSDLMPSISVFSFKKCRTVMSLGIQYFVVQICSLVLWSSNSILIAQFYDPASTERFVYYYTCYYKIFSTIVSLVAIVSTSVWISAGRALANHDARRLKGLCTVSFSYAAFLSLGAILAASILQFLFDLWLGASEGSAITVDAFSSIVFLCYCIATIFSETLIVFSNAFSRLKGQVIVSIIFAASKIPLLFLFNKLRVLPSQWQLVVLYNVLYSIVMFVVLSFSLRFFLKKEGLLTVPDCEKNGSYSLRDRGRFYEINL